MAVLVGALALGGCRSGADSLPGADAPVSVGTVGAPGPSGDPLGGIETSLDQLEPDPTQESAG